MAHLASDLHPPPTSSGIVGGHIGRFRFIFKLQTQFNLMMNLIHLVMFGFIVGAGLCMLHYLGQRLLESREVECPWKQAKHTAARAARLGGLGLGAYLLASVGWAVLPAALTGFLVTRPALVPVRVDADRSA